MQTDCQRNTNISETLSAHNVQTLEILWGSKLFPENYLFYELKSTYTSFGLCHYQSQYGYAITKVSRNGATDEHQTEELW